MAYATPGTVAAGDVATAAAWNVITNDVIDHETRLLQLRRIAYIERSTAYTINQTAIASATDIFSSDLTWTATGATYIVEIFCLAQSPANGFTKIFLTDGGNNALGSFGTCSAGTQITLVPFFARKYYTPAAGTATINARGIYLTTGNGAIQAGDGTGSNDPVAFLAVYGPVLT
jgi:hypothetical protein